MTSSKVPRAQLAIDFDYDDRIVKLSQEIAIMLAPHLFRQPPLSMGAHKTATLDMAARIAKLAFKRAKTFVEPQEDMMCHSCDATVGPEARTRVVVCLRCAFEGGSPGSSG